MDAIGENPYLLTEAQLGAPFEKVDAFALEVGLSGEDPRRVEAGILFELRHNLGNGHTFLPAEKLVDATVALLELDRDTVQIALEQLAQTQRVYLEPLRNLTACYLPELYEAETYVQARLQQMCAMPAGQAQGPGISVGRGRTGGGRGVCPAPAGGHCVGGGEPGDDSHRRAWHG